MREPLHLEDSTQLPRLRCIRCGILCRLAQVEDARGKLQEALTCAERQLAASEARVTSLQSAVEKSEERAASLDLQVKAKSNPASGKYFQPSPCRYINLRHGLPYARVYVYTLEQWAWACMQKLAPQPVCEILFRTPLITVIYEAHSVCPDPGGPSAAGSSQEVELSKTIAALRKDVAEAQQQAAQEAGHVAQYKSLAEGAEENTRIVQVYCALLCTRRLIAVLHCLLHMQASLVCSPPIRK